MRRKFLVRITKDVWVDVDVKLTPDDEWRECMYDIHTLEGIAEMLAYNHVVNGVDDISRLDGFADREKCDCVFTDDDDETEILREAK